MVTVIDRAGRSAAADIEADVRWFSRILRLRLRLHGRRLVEGDLVHKRPPDILETTESSYASMVADLSDAERLVVVLALLPHVKPAALDPFLLLNTALNRRFTEFGGVMAENQCGFLPTHETALFLLAGDDIEARLRWAPVLSPHAPLFARRILERATDQPPGATAAARLDLSLQALDRMLAPEGSGAVFRADFPAAVITTAQGWDDLVLSAELRHEIDEIIAWRRHEHALMNDWRLSHRLKPGYRVLFHGPPGTGKTLTACLIGQALAQPVYRVDLSRIVSKYIGETEKNLGALFDAAQDADVVLFFDEADSLFGRRSESRTANDRAANQQVAYLLQRIEDFPGLVILASNLKANMDDAFARRLQASIHFALPDYDQRLALWEGAFRNKPFTLAADVDLPALARTYALAGGGVMNVLRYACLQAIARKPAEVLQDDLKFAARRELLKEGRLAGR